MPEIKQMLPVVTGKLKELKDKDSILIENFKRDRSLVLTQTKLHTYSIHENGFLNKVYNNLTWTQAKTLLEKLAKDEFPHSARIYISIKRHK